VVYILDSCTINDSPLCVRMGTIDVIVAQMIFRLTKALTFDSSVINVIAAHENFNI
jgi:hypothetical protein